MKRYSSQPRRQRRALYTARGMERRRRMTVPLSRELRTKYHRRNLPVRKGDTVRIISGSYAGQEQRVAKVQLRLYAVTLDNVTGKTAEAKLKPLPVRPSHLVLTKLNLSDPWRRRILRVSAEEVEAESTPEEPRAAEPVEGKSPEPEVAGPATPPSEEAPTPAEPRAPAEPAPSVEEPPAPSPKRRRRSKPAATEE